MSKLVAFLPNYVQIVQNWSEKGVYLDGALLELHAIAGEHVPLVVVVAGGDVVVVPIDGGGDDSECHRGGGASPDMTSQRLATTKHRPQEELVPGFL